MRYQIIAALLLIVAAAGCSSASSDPKTATGPVTGSSSSSGTSRSCDYYAQAHEAFSGLKALPVVNVGSTPREVATFGRSGSNQLGTVLRNWETLAPPVEAKLWHDSMHEWLVTMSGGFEILTAADGRQQREVDGALVQFFGLRDGMMYELEQLNRQYARISAECA